MTVVKPIMCDNSEGEDGPITFRRASSSKNKAAPSKHENMTSVRAINGESSNSAKNTVISTVKSSNKSSTIANVGSRALVSSRPNHLLYNKVTNDNANKSNLKRPYVEGESSDYADDHKPLSQRCKPDSVAVQKSGAADKLVNHSSAGRSASNNRDKIGLDRQLGKSLPSDDSDDGKPLSTKFPTATLGKGSSPHNMIVLHSHPRASSPFKKINASNRDFDNDLKDEKPSASRTLDISRKDCDDDSKDKKPLVSGNLDTRRMDHSDDSEDRKPLISRFSLKFNSGISAGNTKSEVKLLVPKVKPDALIKKESISDLKSPKSSNKQPLDDKINPTSASKKAKVLDASAPGKVKREDNVEQDSDADDNDYKPLPERIKKSASSDNRSLPKKVLKNVNSGSKKDSKKLKMKKTMKNSGFSKSLKVPPGSGGGQKWTTLEHNGVIFPPPYRPHGVKMLYNGQPVDLTPEQEEVATMFAVMKDTDYVSKSRFIENFMHDWRQILGKNHIIKKFELCDFTPIYEWHLQEKEKKKQMSTEEKKAAKEEKLKQEEKYMWAVVDGAKEKVGNFRVEPPGLFRGRGEHLKMGKLKRRIQPRDITINIEK